MTDDKTILYWRSAIVGIAAEPQRSSLPELSHALNQLTLAVRASELRAVEAERQQWSKHSLDVERERDAVRGSVLDVLEAVAPEACDTARNDGDVVHVAGIVVNLVRDREQQIEDLRSTSPAGAGEVTEEEVAEAYCAFNDWQRDMLSSARQSVKYADVRAVALRRVLDQFVAARRSPADAGGAGTGRLGDVDAAWLLEVEADARWFMDEWMRRFGANARMYNVTAEEAAAVLSDFIFRRTPTANAGAGTVTDEGPAYATSDSPDELVRRLVERGGQAWQDGDFALQRTLYDAADRVHGRGEPFAKGSTTPAPTPTGLRSEGGK